MTIADLLGSNSEFMMNMDAYTADNWLDHTMAGFTTNSTNPNYIRAQIFC